MAIFACGYILVACFLSSSSLSLSSTPTATSSSMVAIHPRNTIQTRSSCFTPNIRGSSKKTTKRYSTTLFQQQQQQKEQEEDSASRSFASKPASYLQITNGKGQQHNQLAYIHEPGISPGVLFCPGFQSNFRGNKSKALHDWCIRSGREYTCFDYSNHGESSSSSSSGGGGTIGRWKGDALNIFDRVTCNPEQILVGSSMGAWIMTLVATERRDRVVGLVGMASAPDFTKDLERFIRSNEELANQMDGVGYADVPTLYPKEEGGGTYRIDRELLAEANRHYLFGDDDDGAIGGSLDLNIPVRLLHGLKDEDVPWRSSRKLQERLNDCGMQDVTLELMEDGDHRLSTPRDLIRMIRCLEQIILSNANQGELS